MRVLHGVWEFSCFPASPETLNPITQGSPDAPRCGFSAQVVQALQATGADFQHFDILQDNAIREGLKVRPEV